MLSCYRVLDLTDEKGFLCGKALGDLGADVIKIEPPGGDPSRNIGPFYHDIPDPEKSLNWFAFNANKKSITLDIETADGQEIFRKPSKSVGEMLFVTGEASYFNQGEELIGILRTITCRYVLPDRQAIGEERQAATKQDVKATSPDLLAFERKRRGSEMRYWEDVEVGMEMEPLEKGLLTMTEISRFGIMVPPIPRRIEVKREMMELGFEREASQKRAGLENASDYGPQRICWMGQFLTDWMGDDGTLKSFTAQIRHPNIIGDSNVIKGRVTGKHVSNGEYLVECEMLVENQAGLVTAPGKAVIALFSRG